jgi:NADPH-dependent glutamate synthase beta subunit-like oxidoreductase
MTELGTPARPLRVAVIGSGPAGFYAAEALFKDPRPVRVDVYDRLPTPYGLVRAGVAPDHQKLKSVIRVYERLAGDERFAFFGNVTVGRDVTVEELRSFYDALVFASGAETDRRLGIPGEDLPGSHTATEFVGWYNAHPDYVDRRFDLSVEAAVVIGQGNVAMDVSRVLAKTVDELGDSDIAGHALDALAARRRSRRSASCPNATRSSIRPTSRSPRPTWPSWRTSRASTRARTSRCSGPSRSASPRPARNATCSGSTRAPRSFAATGSSRRSFSRRTS